MSTRSKLRYHVPSTMQDYKKLIRNAVANQDEFLRLTLSGKRGEHESDLNKVTLRPVTLKGERHIQVCCYSSTKSVTKNYSEATFGGKLDEVLGLAFRQIHLQCASRDLYIRITRKGKALLSEDKPSLKKQAPVLNHNRTKSRRLPESDNSLLLRALGVSDESGRIRPTMRRKYKQINEFLRHIDEVLPSLMEIDSERLSILDCGCGSAALTFSAYHYLKHAKHLDVDVIGVDSNEEIIAKCLTLRDSLGWSELEFCVSRILTFEASPAPNLVLSLHACDTATDEAIACGIKSGARAILAAPCCQHELHGKLKQNMFKPVLRHGILEQRLADILTDTFRALILRLMGYRTKVIEFIAPEHTSKNLMIRAEYGTRHGAKRYIREYLQMKDFWQVTPALEGMLGKPFQRVLEDN